MKTHKLKIWPEYFKAVKDGRKTFEVRVNDREFQFGDAVVLEEWDPDRDYIDSARQQLGPAKGYTGRYGIFRIGYIYPLDNNVVVFSLLK